MQPPDLWVRIEEIGSVCSTRARRMLVMPIGRPDSNRAEALMVWNHGRTAGDLLTAAALAVGIVTLVLAALATTAHFPTPGGPNLGRQLLDGLMPGAR